MCGRYAFFDIALVQDRFSLDKIPDDLKPMYNAAPSMEMPVILGENPKELVYARWGLVPSWAKDENIGYKMINARVETISDKPAYKRPFEKQRCLVPANGFYEWKKTKVGKVPYMVKLKSDEIFSFAGIYDRWMDPSGKEAISFTIITMDSNAAVKGIHDRMPLILRKVDEKDWLATPKIPQAEDRLIAYKVSTRVNSADYNEKDVLEPVKDLTSF